MFVLVIIDKKIPIYFTHYVNDHIVIKKLLKPEEMLNPKDDLPTINESVKLDEKNKKILINRGEKYLVIIEKALTTKCLYLRPIKLKIKNILTKKNFYKKL